jgi:hypothetical protein
MGPHGVVGASEKARAAQGLAHEYGSEQFVHVSPLI